ncbi:MAG: MFS transporter, partial [Mobilitalea sp.]
FTAKERVTYKETQDISFKRIFQVLLKNKYLLIYYIGYMAIGTTNTLQIMAVYFAATNLGDEGMYTIIMAVSLLPTLMIAPLLPKLIQKFGKRKITVWCSIAVIVLCIVQYFAGYANLAVFLVIAGIRVACMETPLMLYGMFTADCIEYGTYTTGEHVAGISFSLQTFVTKLSGAFCNGLCLALMAAFGYVQQAKQQTAQSLEGIWIIMSLVPIAGFAVMLIIMKFYKLDEKEVNKMMVENQKSMNL